MKVKSFDFNLSKFEEYVTFETYYNKETAPVLSNFGKYMKFLTSSS